MSPAERPTVVLCGAGISTEPPSVLPSGEGLARSVVDLLLASSDIVLDAQGISELKRAIGSIRLEVALERLSRYISAATLVQVYALLCGAMPNFNHLALAAASLGCIVTTNQDVLLEAAAAGLEKTPEILHLHGRCDRPETIVTLISQYMAGLPPDTVRSLRAAILDQVVLVVGYSGRDRDVMAVLEESEPARIRWLLHPDAAESPDLGWLRHQVGARLTIEVGVARDELARLLSPEQRAAVDRALHEEAVRRPQVPREVREQFAAIERVPRNLGLTAILRHVSRYPEVELVYAALGGLAPGSPIPVRLAIGSTLAHQQRFDAAIEAYESVVGASDASAIDRCLALIGEVEVLRNTSQGARAADKLQDLERWVGSAPTSRERSRVIGRAASHRGGIARVDGDIPRALRAYAEALRAYDESCDLDEKLESMCWHADVLRMQGHYLEAHAEVATVIAESLVYVRHIARAWALLVGADVDCLRGDLEGSERGLELSAKHLLTANNRQGLVWNEVLRASHRRAAGRLDEADAALAAAATRIAAGAAPRHLAQVRLSLERADLARARGDHAWVRRHLAAATKLLASSRHFATRPSYLWLHVRLVEAETRRAEGAPGAADELADIACEYEALGFDGCGARARTGAWLCAAGAPPPRELLADCLTHGRQHEVDRLEGRTLGFYPVLFA